MFSRLVEHLTNLFWYSIAHKAIYVSLKIYIQAGSYFEGLFKRNISVQSNLNLMVVWKLQLFYVLKLLACAILVERMPSNEWKMKGSRMSIQYAARSMKMCIHMDKLRMDAEKLLQKIISLYCPCNIDWSFHPDD